MDLFEEFYNKALKFLSYRPRSEKEVREKLKSRISSKKVEEVENVDGVIDRVIQKLKEKKFINDEEFAKGFLESRLRFKPRSIRLIKLELKKKGISDDIIQTIIHDSKFMIHSDLEQAKRLVEKRLPRYKGLGRQKIYEKMGRYLASKGFDWDTIKKSIDEVLKKGV